jgi:hypothetical protein
MTVWEKPTFEEIEMNAEIGSYQAEDGGDQGGDPLFVADTTEAAAGVHV